MTTRVLTLLRDYVTPLYQQCKFSLKYVHFEIDKILF